MVRKLYNPFAGCGLDDECSPVIDPASAADSEIPREGRHPEKSEKEIPVHNKSQAAPENAKAEHPLQEPDAEKPDPCPFCEEREKTRLLALADLENARKRLVREKEEFFKFAGESIMADILPALDNLDLALAYAPEGETCRNFVIGVDMTRKLLLDALAKHGLVQVGQLGESFDPARHEAVNMEPHQDYVSGQVCGLMNKGYLLKDRLLRPARVSVCKNEE